MSDDLVTCYNCATEIDSDSERHDIDEHAYCDDCIVVCSDCDTIVPIGNSIGEWCENCGNVCDRCDDSMSRHNRYYVGNDTW